MLKNIIKNFNSPNEILLNTKEKLYPKKEEKPATIEISIIKTKHKPIMVNKGGLYQIGCPNCNLVTDLHTDQIMCYMEWDDLKLEFPNCYIKKQKDIKLIY